MSFTGFSISQASTISSQGGRLSAVETLAASKVAQTVFEAAVALVEAKDTEQDSRLTVVEGVAASKVAQTVYDAKIAAVDAKDEEQDDRLTAVEGVAASKVAQTAYDAKIALVDAKDTVQDNRLTTVEGVAASKVAQTDYDTKIAAVDAKDAAQDARLDAIEGDISGRVATEINAKVAQITFDSLATELRNADSDLTTALATKVSTVTQAAVDQAQNDLINQRATLNQLNSTISGFNTTITNLDAAKVGKNDYNAKVNALEEFIKVFLNTYTITLPNNTTYAYSGSLQYALAIGFQPESPVSLAYNSNQKILSFNLPNTYANLSFVDMNINGQWVQRWNPALTAQNRSYYSITGSVISINLSAITPAPTGTISVFTRYDVFTGTSAAGNAQISV